MKSWKDNANHNKYLFKYLLWFLVYCGKIIINKYLFIGMFCANIEGRLIYREKEASRTDG